MDHLVVEEEDVAHQEAEQEEEDAVVAVEEAFENKVHRFMMNSNTMRNQ